MADSTELFAIVPESVLIADISDRAVRLFAWLQRHGAESSFPSRARLAKLLRCSTDSVDRAIRELVGIGVLRVQARRTARGDRTSSLYTLTSGVAAPVRLGVAAPMRLPGRALAATPAAPVRQRTRGSLTRGTEGEQGEVIAPPAAGAAALGEWLRQQLVRETETVRAWALIEAAAHQLSGRCDEDALVAIGGALAAANAEHAVEQRRTTTMNAEVRQ